MFVELAGHVSTATVKKDQQSGRFARLVFFCHPKVYLILTVFPLKSRVLKIGLRHVVRIVRPILNRRRF
ncbi:MAG: hypothetical protein M2R45_04502 [Verrucomicrobia subdivision 3 bacterium]|nr:hypothetical protein [Limisphaerales bacterium]MCS1415950.1 hypothetical protein [Limisphaerales bacterium]